MPYLITHSFLPEIPPFRDGIMRQKQVIYDTVYPISNTLILENVVSLTS